MNRKGKPLLERFGVNYLKRCGAALPKVESVDAIHYLNPDERRALRRVQWGAMARAALAGGLSGFLFAGAEVFLRPMLGETPTTDQQLFYWGLVLGIGGLATAFEIAFLYWDALRSVHALAHHAGLDLFGDEEATEEEVAGALARAALELPNPPDEVFGVDPRRGISRTRLLVATLLYKAKIGLSNFLLKMVIRRFAGRAAVRAWLPYIGVPVTALWNLAVCWKVLREARIRVMGPSAVKELFGHLFCDVELSEEGRAAAVRAVGCTIVQKRDMHPNLEILLQHTRSELDSFEVPYPDDLQHFLDGITTLVKEEQTAVLRLLNLACILDGRLITAERKLIRMARTACDRETDFSQVQALRRAFVRGDEIQAERVQEV